jgi:hypothetical protein
MSRDSVKRFLTSGYFNESVPLTPFKTITQDSSEFGGIEVTANGSLLD